MFTIDVILAIACLVALVAVLIYKSFVGNTITHNMLANDPNVIRSVNRSENNNKLLTLQERMELSWQFLYEITEQIVNKFSNKDVQLVNQLGHILIDNGMKYEHVIDFTIKYSISKATNLEQVPTATRNV